jgi:thymidylate kinase
MKIVIEGMDGVGKTTLAKRLAQDLNMKYVDGLLHTYFEEEGYTKDEMEELNRSIYKFYNIKNSVIRAWFFGLGNIFNLQYYDGDVIIDRNCLTTYFWNADEQSKKIFPFIMEMAGKPDLVIVLVADPEIRYKRLYNRNPEDYDLTDDEKKVYGYDKFIEGAEYMNLNYCIVNADDCTADEIYEIVKEKILSSVER